jgi:hypothetical protein
MRSEFDAHQALTDRASRATNQAPSHPALDAWGLLMQQPLPPLHALDFTTARVTRPTQDWPDLLIV